MIEDAVNYARLPSTERMELDYRTQRIPPTTCRSRTWAVVAGVSLVAIAFTILVQLAGGWFATLGATVTLASLAVPVAIGYFLSRRNVAHAAAMGSVLPLTQVVAVPLWWSTQYYGLRVAFVLIALAFIMLLVNRITEHYWLWLTAHPRLSRESRQRRRQWWADFHNHRLTSNTAETDEHRQQLQALRGFRFRLYFVCLAYAAVILLPFTLFHGLRTLIIPSILAVLLLMVQPGGVLAAVAASARALTSWITYAHATPDAPGLFRSPAGSSTRRQLFFVAILVFFAAVALPAARYLPIAYELTPSEPWYAVSEKADSLPGRFTPDPPPSDNLERKANETWGDFENRKEQHRKDRDADSARWRRNQLDRYVAEVPLGWFYIAVNGLAQGSHFFWGAIAASFAASFILSPLVLFTALTAAAGPVFATAYRAIEQPDAHEDAQRRGIPPWQWHVDRLRQSKDQLEHRHLWLGVHSLHDYPVLLDRKILTEHAYIVGDSGSGKTALGVTPLVAQLIRFADSPVIIVDLKGDMALFEAARDEAANAGLKFKHFTNELGKSSYTFNPITNVDHSSVSLNQVCETLWKPQPFHGEGYGRSYYSRVARRWLSNALRQHRNLQTFEELYQIAADPDSFHDDKERHDAFELVAVIESLSTFDQLNVRRGDARYAEAAIENDLHVPDAITNNQVVYFWLHAAVEGATVREMAKLAVYSAITAAFRPPIREDGRRKQIYLVIDEFQRIASTGFKIVLEQARSMGVGTILANQTFADLQTSDVDLRPTVQTNTRFKQMFSAQDLEQQDQTMKASGEMVHYRRSWTTAGVGATESVSEIVGPRILRNDVIQISDDPFATIVQVARGSGYTQFGGFSIPVKTSYHVDETTFINRNAARGRRDRRNNRREP